MKQMSVSLWLLFTVVTTAQLFLIDCDASELTGRSTTVDPYVSCVRILAFDSQFEVLSKKLPLYDMAAISFAMLADDSLATPQERKDILAWFGKQESCWKDSEELHRSQWPPDMFALFQEENSEIHNIGLDLYSRKITFGEANKRVQDYGNNFRARVITTVKQYQAEIAAQKAAAEQQEQRKQDAAERLASQQQAYENAQEQAAAAALQQRKQLIVNFLNQLGQLAPRTTYTNCYGGAGSISCTTR
jgi:hypothetical protein